MMEKKFEIYSTASYLCDQLKLLIHKPDGDEEKLERTSKARKWYSQNNLYLEPEIRKGFYNFILDVEMYKSILEEWQITGQEEGWDAEQTRKKNQELKDTFHGIMQGLQSNIQSSIDTYYNIINK